LLCKRRAADECVFALHERVAALQRLKKRTNRLARLGTERYLALPGYFGLTVMPDNGLLQRLEQRRLETSA